MLKYKVVNVESGEVRTWEVEENNEKAKVAHRQLRKIVKRDVELYPDSVIEIEVTADSDKQLATQYRNKANYYLQKVRDPKVAKEMTESEKAVMNAKMAASWTNAINRNF